LYYDVDARVIKEADFIIKENATVRAAAKAFGVGKSTVHYDMTKRLPFLDEDRAKKVKNVLFINLSERHIRGGLATRKKYKNMHR
jgi:putative DeoR family transcriptional regulator (stage III sporulation protein D)